MFRHFGFATLVAAGIAGWANSASAQWGPAFDPRVAGTTPMIMRQQPPPQPVYRPPVQQPVFRPPPVQQPIFRLPPPQRPIFTLPPPRTGGVTTPMYIPRR